MSFLKGFLYEKYNAIFFFYLKDSCHIKTNENNVIHINKKDEYAILSEKKKDGLCRKKKRVIQTLSEWKPKERCKNFQTMLLVRISTIQKTI